METIRILALDGGGIRGLFTSEFLIRFCDQAGLDPSRLFEHFDLILGTSIGGLQAMAYADGHTPETMKQFFYERGPVIFKDHGILPGYKARVVMGLSTDSTFYKQEDLKEAIKAIVGEKSLGEIGGRVVIPSWSMSENFPQLFSNIPNYEPYLSGRDNRACDVGLATSAAPLYFPKASFNDKEYIDGGVIQNNPALLGLLIGKRLFPNRNRVCLLSVGTGSAWPQQGSVLPEVDGENSIVPSNVRYMYYLLDDVFIGGVQSLTSRTLSFLAKSIYEQFFYLRFQYRFPEGEDAPMDEAKKEYLDKLVTLSKNRYEGRQTEITNFINHFNLNAPWSV